MVDVEALYPDDIVCVIDTSADYHTWTPSMADWRRRCSEYDTKKAKNLFSLLARRPKRPKDATEKFLGKTWSDTILLDSDTIPKVLERIAALEAEAKIFVTPEAGWSAKSNIHTLISIGRRDLFSPREPDPMHQLVAQIDGERPKILFGTEVDAAAIGGLMSLYNSPEREKRQEKRSEEAARQRAADLERAAQEATIAQAPIVVQKALRLKNTI